MYYYYGQVNNRLAFHDGTQPSSCRLYTSRIASFNSTTLLALIIDPTVHHTQDLCSLVLGTIKAFSNILNQQ